MAPGNPSKPKYKTCRRYNDPGEVDYVVGALPPIIERLRQITPFNAQRATF